MKNMHLCIFLVFSTVLALGSAQYFGDFGRNVLIRQQESAYPFLTQSRSGAVPLLARVNADTTQNIQLASTQISRGSELFSFDMFRVSVKFN